MVDAVEERDDPRVPDRAGRALLQRAEQPGRLHRHDEQVDGLDERRAGGRAGPGALGAVPQLDAVDEQCRRGPLARDHRHVMPGRGEARPEEDAHPAGPEDRDPGHGQATSPRVADAMRSQSMSIPSPGPVGAWTHAAPSMWNGSTSP